jgi:hypothetical protein
MRTALILVAALLAATTAQADTIGLHLASWHSKPGYNNVNPGAYWRGDSGLTVGAYCNSESRSALFPGARRCELARYVGYSFEAGPVTLTAGVIDGYQRGAVPMVLPSVKLGDTLRLAFIPRIDPKRGAHVLHLMAEF